GSKECLRMRQSNLVSVNPNRDERRRKAMMMVPVSEALRELLHRQGMAREGLAGPVAHGMKTPALSAMASSGEVVADGAGGAPHRPKGLREGGERNPMGISGKGRGPKPAPVDPEVGSVS